MHNHSCACHAQVLCEGGTDTNAYSVDRVLTVLTAVDLLGEMSKVRGTVGWDFQYFANAHTSWREMYNRGDEAPFKGVSKDAYMLAIRRCMLAWATAQGSPEFQLLSSNQKMDIRLKALLKDEKFRTLELMRYASGGCNLQALVQKVGDEYYLVPPVSTFAKFTDLLELEGAGLDETVDFDGSVAEMLKPQLNGEPHRATITPWLHQGFILPIDYEYMYVKSDVQRLASDPDKDQDENRSAKKQKVNDGKTLKVCCVTSALLLAHSLSYALLHRTRCSKTVSGTTLCTKSAASRGASRDSSGPRTRTKST